MPNLVKVNYERTGKSKSINEFGGAFGTTDLKSYGFYVDWLRK